MTHSVGKIIKQRLKKLHKTQGWLAEHVGVSSVAVSKWIGTGEISRANAVKTAELLDISVDELLGSSAAVESARNSLALIYVDSDELRLITAYREATSMGKALISTAARGAPKEPSLPLGLVRNDE